MTTPSPRTVAQLTDDVVALSDRLHQVGLELRRVQSPAGRAPGPAPLPPAPPRPSVAPQAGPPQPFRSPRVGPPVPQFGAAPGAVPRPAHVPPAGRPPGAQRPSMPQVGPPGSPPEPREAWWTREGVLSRILAIAGSAVTLLGVVMLLVLAVQAGYLGPVPRVIGGAVLAAGLIGLALRIRGRAGGEVGSVALAGTGFAGLYLDVVAATAGYGYLPVVAGLALTAVVVAAGILLADRWRSEVLAVIVVAGGAVLCPVVVDRIDLVTTAFLLVLQAAALPSVLRRGWRAVAVVSGVPPLLASLVMTIAAAGDYPVLDATIGACLVTAVALVVALATQRVRPADVLATLGLLSGAAPTLLVAMVVDEWAGAAVAAGLAVVVGAAMLTPWLVKQVRLAGLAVCSLAVLEATLLAVHGAGAAALLLGESLVVVVMAHQLRSRALLLVATGFAAVGGLTTLPIAPPDSLSVVGRATAVTSWPGVVALALLALVAVALTVEIRFSRQVADLRAVWVAAGLVALYGLTGTLVGVGVLSLGRQGFVVGHTVATVTWTVLALALLVLGLRRGDTAVTARVAGLVLAASAIAKLLLFDLAALSGVFRVVAFLVVGLLLLTAGTRYARLLGTAATDVVAQEGNPQVGAGGGAGAVPPGGGPR